MVKQAPSVGRILTMVLFALSCFGLLTYLWLTFGGPTPLKPKGYRVVVPFKEAGQLAQEADVRISGVRVGKVKKIEANPEQSRSDVELEIDPKYAPIPKDSRVNLRAKSLLGEQYLELTPGSKGGPYVADGGTLPKGNVADSVELDEVFRSFDARTRAAFQTWQQQLAITGAGRGREIGEAFAQFAPLEQQSTKLLRILDRNSQQFSALIRNTGITFSALSAREDQLRSLVRNSNTVFATTAARNNQLAETFVALPTFQIESRALLRRLDSFAADANPIIKQLVPVATAFGPVFQNLEDLAPDLRDFIVDLGPTITASVKGVPAASSFLQSFAPFIGSLDPALTQLNPLLQYLGAYRSELMSFAVNVTAATQATLGSPGHIFHYLRAMNPVGPWSLAAYPNRTKANRTNTYAFPRATDSLTTGLFGFETRQCSNPSAPTPGLAPVGSVPNTPWYTDKLRSEILKYALSDNPENVLAPECKQQGPVTASGKTTMFPQLDANSAPPPLKFGG
jgi:phospholipid/cholesterol/gamma-HCH transport system substrate-binding protein